MTLSTRRTKPDLTLGPFVVAWIETFCVHGPGDVLGRPVELTRDEKQFLHLAYELDLDGRRRVRRAVRGLPKGSRKTEFAAWVALAEMAGPVRCSGFDADGRPVPVVQHDPFVVCAAASYDQADLLFGAATACIREGPLRDFFDCFDQEIQFKDRPGVLKRVPAVAGTNDGLRPTFFVADETHEWTGNKARVHMVIANGLSKRQDAWSLDITTAGNPKVASVARSSYEYGAKVVSGEVDDPSLLFDWREPEMELEALLDGETRAAAIAEINDEPWKRLDDIEAQFHRVPLHEFARYFVNMWAEPDEERWLPLGVWDDAGDPGRTVEDGARVVLGFDGSYSGDSTALVAATVEDRPHMTVLGLWEHPGGQVDWRVPIDEVDAAVREAFARFDVARMYADPPYWSQQIGRWAELFGSPPVMEFQTYVRKRMAEACSRFFQAVTTGQLSHDGHPGLARHVDNAVLKETAQGAYITKESSSSPRKIDAAVAAVIATAGVFDVLAAGESPVPWVAWA